MSPGPLHVPQSIYEDMVAHCRSEYPKEACGLLVANAVGTVETVYRMKNVEESPIGYTMDPNEQLQVEKRMRQHNQRLIGIYHSHTASAAEPSTVDVSLAISPDISYVIVSLKDRAHPDVQSYRIDGARVIPEKVQVV